MAVDARRIAAAIVLRVFFITYLPLIGFLIERAVFRRN